MDCEAPCSGEPVRAQRGPDSFHQPAAAKFAPGEEPEIEVATEVGDVPRGHIGDERRTRGISHPHQDQAADRGYGALPADLVETVERTQHTAWGRGTHGRKERAVEHSQPQLVRGYADPTRKERQRGNGDEHTADAAHRIEREREAGRSLEIVALPVERAG